VLFNLGAPDRPEAVRPFLFNLFNDPAILDVPAPMRGILARIIAARRSALARDIYAKLGGGSPLLANTAAQARALKEALADLGQVEVVPAMRYWHPMTDEAIANVKAADPDEVVLLPLYPQYSATTTGSSQRLWAKNAARRGLKAHTRAVCCYPAEAGFITALAALIRPVYERARAASPGRAPRLLFSAHGLPKRLVEKGDPYQAQVEMTAAAAVRALSIPGLDWRICYQSRVGPLEWLGPYAEDEIARAGEEGTPLVVAPIAFVSEHSETLVELDITYRDEARKKRVPIYERVPTVGTHPKFIAGLSRLVRDALKRPALMAPGGGSRLCPAGSARCALGA
ncbi:MAG: ferrochelatase, partial [Alphaproteobacteria bacterium]|nr:ferrochelatase [Alphaproteobacteria bacterium]